MALVVESEAGIDLFQRHMHVIRDGREIGSVLESVRMPKGVPASIVYSAHVDKVGNGCLDTGMTYAAALELIEKYHADVERKLVAIANEAAAVARGERAELPADHGDRMLAAMRGDYHG